MKQKKIVKCEDGRIAVILIVAITVILAAGLAGLMFGIGGNPYYYIEIEESPDGDFLLIRTLSYNDDLPLTNVNLSILEHGEGRLLSGPRLVNESGYAFLHIPEGYSDYFDIVGNYKDETQTFTVDNRPHLVKSENELGIFGISLINTMLAFVLGIIGAKFWKCKKINTSEKETVNEQLKTLEHPPDAPDLSDSEIRGR